MKIDEHRGIGGARQIGEQRQAGGGFGIVGGQQFLGLIDGDDQRRRAGVVAIAAVFGDGELAEQRRDGGGALPHGVADVGAIARRCCGRVRAASSMAATPCSPVSAARSGRMIGRT